MVKCSIRRVVLLQTLALLCGIFSTNQAFDNAFNLFQRVFHDEIVVAVKAYGANFATLPAQDALSSRPRATPPHAICCNGPAFTGPTRWGEFRAYKAYLSQTLISAFAGPYGRPCSGESTILFCSSTLVQHFY